MYPRNPPILYTCMLGHVSSTQIHHLFFVVFFLYTCMYKYICTSCSNFFFFFVRFMDAGGWPMLNMWLVEAKKAQNVALVVELLQVQCMTMTLSFGISRVHCWRGVFTCRPGGGMKGSHILMICCCQYSSPLTFHGKKGCMIDFWGRSPQIINLNLHPCTGIQAEPSPLQFYM